MHDYKYDVYLAGPFFNDGQKERMDNVKALLIKNGLKVADPRELGPVIVDTAEQVKTPQFFERIFQGNIDGMADSFMLIASVDDKDTGTSFELGWFYAQFGRPIATFAFEGVKPNVMLAQAVDGHLKSPQELEQFVQLNHESIKAGNWVSVVHYLENMAAKAGSDE